MGRRKRNKAVKSKLREANSRFRYLARHYIRKGVQKRAVSQRCHKGAMGAQNDARNCESRFRHLSTNKNLAKKEKKTSGYEDTLNGGRYIRNQTFLFYSLFFLRAPNCSKTGSTNWLEQILCSKADCLSRKEPRASESEYEIAEMRR